MSVAQRRKILELMPLLLREAVYHRNHEQDEELPGVSLWTLGIEESSVCGYQLRDPQVDSNG